MHAAKTPQVHPSEKSLSMAAVTMSIAAQYEHLRVREKSLRQQQSKNECRFLSRRTLVLQPPRFAIVANGRYGGLALVAWPIVGQCRLWPSIKMLSVGSAHESAASEVGFETKPTGCYDATKVGYRQPTCLFCTRDHRRGRSQRCRLLCCSSGWTRSTRSVSEFRFTSPVPSTRPVLVSA